MLDIETVRQQIAQRLYANDEAVSHLRRALALMPDCDPAAQPPPAQLYEQVADLLVLGGKGDEARQAYGEALNCLGSEEGVWRASLWRKIGSSWSGQYESDPAHQSLERALRVLGPEPASPDPAWWLP